MPSTSLFLIGAAESGLKVDNRCQRSFMKINYQIEMERELNKIQQSGNRPRLMLHGCCAPCSSYVLELLTRYFDIALFFYNPNISPAEEYEHRFEELTRMVRQMPHTGDISIIRGQYEPQVFYDICAGHENDPEGGERCRRCFLLRLGKTAALASKMQFDYFSTTLSISPLKDAQLINSIGSIIGRSSNVSWLFSDFKKKDGYKRSCELSQIYGLYRQDYCGCVFSRRKKNTKDE